MRFRVYCRWSNEIRRRHRDVQNETHEMDEAEALRWLERTLGELTNEQVWSWVDAMGLVDHLATGVALRIVEGFNGRMLVECGVEGPTLAMRKAVEDAWARLR